MIIYHEILLGDWRLMPLEMSGEYNIATGQSVVFSARHDYKALRQDSQLKYVPDEELGAYLKENYPRLCKAAYGAWKARAVDIAYTETN